MECITNQSSECQIPTEEKKCSKNLREISTVILVLIPYSVYSNMWIHWSEFRHSINQMYRYRFILSIHRWMWSQAAIAVNIYIKETFYSSFFLTLHNNLFRSAYFIMHCLTQQRVNIFVYLFSRSVWFIFLLYANIWL